MYKRIFFLISINAILDFKWIAECIDLIKMHVGNDYLSYRPEICL